MDKDEFCPTLIHSESFPPLIEFQSGGPWATQGEKVELMLIMLRKHIPIQPVWKNQGATCEGGGEGAEERETGSLLSAPSRVAQGIRILMLNTSR